MWAETPLRRKQQAHVDARFFATGNTKIPPSSCQNQQCEPILKPCIYEYEQQKIAGIGGKQLALGPIIHTWYQYNTHVLQKHVQGIKKA